MTRTLSAMPNPAPTSTATSVRAAVRAIVRAVCFGGGGSDEAAAAVVVAAPPEPDPEPNDASFISLSLALSRRQPSTVSFDAVNVEFHALNAVYDVESNRPQRGERRRVQPPSTQ